MTRQLGGVFGIAILAAAFTAAGGYASPHAFSDGFTAAIGLSALLSGAGALAGLGLPSRRQANEAPAPTIRAAATSAQAA
jgi:hypothetical protein